MVFAWKRKVDDRRATLPLRTRARVTQLVALGEDASQVTASVRLEVVQGVARQIELALPEGLTVNQVAGATVSDWTQQAGTLRVIFLEPVATEASVVISAESRTPREGAVTVPLIRVPLAEREGGGVAVDVVGPGEIADRQPRGLEPADVSDLGDIVSGRESPSMVAFQYKALPGSAPRALTLTVSRYSPQAVLVANVEEARYDALVGEDGKTLVRGRYAVRNNQRSFLAVSLPPQSVLWSASLAGRPVRPGLSATGGLLLPLQKGRSGEEAPTFIVELVYLQRANAWTDKGEARLELPAVDSPCGPHGIDAPSLSSIPRRASSRNLPRRERSRSLEPGAPKRSRSLDRCEILDCGPVARCGSLEGFQGADGQLPEGGGQNAAGCAAHRGRVSGVWPGRLPCRRIDSRNARPGARHRLQARRGPMTSVTRELVRLVARSARGICSGAAGRAARRCGDCDVDASGL